MAQSDSGRIVDLTAVAPVEVNQALIGTADSAGSGDWSFGTDGNIFVVDSNQDLLFTLDQGNGAATLVGPTGSGGLTVPADLTWDGVNLITIDLAGGELFTLNLGSGAPTLVGNTGLSGWQGLAADPTDEGQLYAMDQSRGFYRVAPDGTLTLISNSVAFPGGNLIATLAFDAEGQLWASDFSGGQYGTIDTVTGATTQVGTTILNIQGWDFDADGTLWAESSTADALYTIDLATGIATLIGSDGLDFVKGLAIIRVEDDCDPCDMNCDKMLNAFDIEPFLTLLFDPESDPCCGERGDIGSTGDTNGDGEINAFDIEGFLDCLFP